MKNKYVKDLNFLNNLKMKTQKLVLMTMMVLALGSLANPNTAQADRIYLSETEAEERSKVKAQKAEMKAQWKDQRTEYKTKKIEARDEYKTEMQAKKVENKAFKADLKAKIESGEVTKEAAKSEVQARKESLKAELKAKREARKSKLESAREDFKSKRDERVNQIKDKSPELAAVLSSFYDKIEVERDTILVLKESLIASVEDGDKTKDEVRAEYKTAMEKYKSAVATIRAEAKAEAMRIRETMKSEKNTES